MASSRRPRTERGAVDLLEQAVHLLRQAPIDALACYYVGALPFVLGALYFIADASRSAFAQQRLGASGAGLALLLVWMKCWQSAFTQMLLARVGGEAPPRWTSGRVVRLALVQAAVQPWGLFVLPLAEVALVPALWAYPFFQNVTVLGDGRAGQGIGPTVRAAWRQAGLWPRQNAHLALLLAIFGLFVFLNVAMALLVPAWVLKRFLGIDSVFMRGGFQVANTTFLGLTLGLTYLCLDPVAKTVYALRCFYGQSIHTGWDLRADLRHFLSARGAAAVVALVAAVLLCRPNAGLAAEATVPGAEPAPVVAPPEVPHEQLDESIARVIARREYAWRLPREQAPEGGTRSFLRSVAGWIQGRMDALARWLERREERDQQRQDSATRRRGESSWRGWAGAVRSVLYVLLVASAIVLATMLWVSLRRRPPKPAAAAASAAVAPADLDDESLSADRLPEEGWLDLAGQMLREGDYRRAVRAMFLASLAMLGRGGLVRLARYKSNHDYETELARRSHALPGLIGVFGQNVTCFEDVWYGMHEVSDGMVVARNFLPPRRLIGRLGSTLLYLGAGAPGQAQAMDKDFAECLRRFASAGGRVVIAFSPAAGGRLVSGFIPDDVGPLGAEFGFVLAGREEPPLPETSARRAVPAGGQDWLAGLAWHTPMYFEPSDPEWRTVYACDDRPVVIERPLGRGSVAVCSDSYALSNEAMAYRRDSRFLAWVLSGREAVFDETHLGVAEETDIAALGRRYGLGGALGVLLLLAGLHVWKSWASFLPRQSVSPAGHEHGGVIGEASTAGLLNLLRRAIPRRRLASVCVEEWSRSAGRLEGSARAALEQARRAAEQEQCAPARRQDPLSAYRTVRGTLSERSHRHAI